MLNVVGYQEQMEEKKNRQKSAGAVEVEGTDSLEVPIR